MKVLHSFAWLSLVCASLFGAQNDANAFLSKERSEYFRLEGERVESSSDMLRDSWIAPLMLNYSYGVSEAYDAKATTQKASIAIDQPIFQSGGIYYGIKYAEASRKYASYSLEVAQKKAIKDAVALLMQIRQSQKRIEKQQLLIENAAINLELKKEQYLSGQLDSGFLDSAILEQNAIVLALYDLQAARERLISKLRVISDADEKRVVLPHLELVEERLFMEQNLLLEQSRRELEKSRYAKNMTITKYLPKVSLYGSYSWDRSENFTFAAGSLAGARETDYLSYGVKASMPINVVTLDDTQTTRVEYLKSKIALGEKQKEQKALYEQVLQNIESFNKKIALSRENQKIYAKLLEDTKSLVAAGYKTKYDVTTLQNSHAIQELDVEIVEFERQLELLTLYEMTANAF